MDFIDKVNKLASKFPKQLEYIKTEEATKNALIMPFIEALGYDIFNPLEVTPELDADIGVRKGEKVDYAIIQGGQPVILFECKSHQTDLADAHKSQLYRYFGATEAKFGVLTNGIIYWFFTDLEKKNKMDKDPFFVFNFLDFDDEQILELKRFTKSTFDVDSIYATAGDLKYTRALKKYLDEQLQSPSDDYVRFFAGKVYSGRLMQSVIERFSVIIEQAFESYITDRVNKRLQKALVSEKEIAKPIAEPIEVESTEEDVKKHKIETTEDEWQAFYIVKSIVRKRVDAERITIRDVLSYCSVLLDDNNRQPICRFRFNRTPKKICLIDKNKDEIKHEIEQLDDIYKYEKQLIETTTYYD